MREIPSGFAYRLLGVGLADRRDSPMWRCATMRSRDYPHPEFAPRIAGSQISTSPQVEVLITPACTKVRATRPASSDANRKKRPKNNLRLRPPQNVSDEALHIVQTPATTLHENVLDSKSTSPLR